MDDAASRLYQHCMAAPIDRRELFRRNPMFAKLTDAQLDQLVAFGRVEQVKNNTPIFRKGDKGDQMMAVLKGHVRISTTGLDGRDLILNIIGAGELIGEIALLDGRERTADVTAVSDCELLVIDRRNFLPFMRENCDIAVQMIDVLCQRMRRSTEQLEDMVFLTFPCRLARRIIAMANHSGLKDPKGRPSTGRISQGDVASMIGMSRESVNKQLAAWSHEGIVEVANRAVVILDLHALAEIGEIEPLH